MNEFMTPPLLITEYYDSLISQIDIYTEETINKYKEKGMPEKRRVVLSNCARRISDNNAYNKYGVETLKNPYEKQKYSIKRTKIPKIEIETIKSYILNFKQNKHS